jgi:tricorn protease
MFFASKLLPAALLATILAFPAASASEAPPDGFYRYPAIGGGAVVFASEGDLWKVPATGGLAVRLTAHEGDEKFPRISPDGKLIAFTAQYEGNDDIYVMPISGGEPRRLTFHPAQDQTIGWTADGKVLFRSRRDHPHGDFRIYAISAGGGIPEMIPLEPAAWISFEPGGKRIAVQKIGLEFHNWKRYKGGEAEEIHVGTLQPLAFTEVAKWEGKDAFPMWAPDGRIYFVTDRWGRPNLASMKPDGSDVLRLTQFDDYDVRWPSFGDGKIVYLHKMDLFSYDIESRQNVRLPVQLPSDRLQVRERFIDPKGKVNSWALSTEGDRIVMEARGDLFAARTRKKGLIRRITESSLARTRGPAVSPDGKLVAAWTEVNGEEQLLLHPSDASGPPRQVGNVLPGWHFAPAWSPDGKWLAWGDEKHRIQISNVLSGAITSIDTAEGEISKYVWSPDSRYLAYVVVLKNLFSQVRIWDSGLGKVYEATDPMFTSFSPAWDPKGKFLALLSDRFINPYLDRSEARFIVNDATLPYVIALQSSGTLPFAARGDSDPADPDEKKEEKQDAKKDVKKAEKPETKVSPIQIDFDGLAGRIVQVPVPAGNYNELRVVDGKFHWLRVPNRGMAPEEDEPEERPAGELQTYDIEKEKLSTVTAGVLAYDVSANGKVLVYESKEGFVRLEAGATAAPKDEAAQEAKIDLSGWMIRINPRDEWKQMLREAWRLQRDFFYDPKMHGVDWEGVWKQYGPLAERISSRDDLADMLGEMFGELSVGHAYHGGGDVRRPKPIGTGLLAADLDYDGASGFWKIRKIYRGDYPDPAWSSPLARADLRVKEGQWLVAVDGRPLVKGEDYLRRLAGRADQEVELSIADSPKLEGARRVVVKTVPNDTRIRYASWIREARAYVNEKSGGKLGYLHLYDMGGLGLKQFARDFPPQWDKRGLIVDDRWNHGGFVAPMILAHLDRKILGIGGTRHGGPVDTVPSRAFHGHLIALVNRQGGSDCETLALGFKEFGLGPVIGTRTWGGWVGIRGDKPLRDGGMVTQPEFGGWDPKGRTWLIEGHGVDPDVELDLGPDGLISGKDIQLDTAIRMLLDKIDKEPRTLAPPPPVVPRPLKPVRTAG